MKIFSFIFSFLSFILQKLFFLLEFFLFLRLALKALKANPQTLVVEWIFRYSEILILPFQNIFPDITLPKGYLIETATLSAMIGYAILAFLIFQLLKLLSRD